MIKPARNLSFPLYAAICYLLGACLLPGTLFAESTPDEELKSKQRESQQHFKDHVEPFLKKYCWDCHGDKRMKAGLNFAPAVKDPGGSAFVKRWKNASVIVETHDMPPEDVEKQPTDEERKNFIDGLAIIKYLSHQDPGPFVIHRLTKVEYANTLHDLLGVDPSIADELPEDVAGEGYLNSLSPLQMEQFLDIANKVLDQLASQKDKPTSILISQYYAKSSAPPSELLQEVKQKALLLAKSAFRRPPTEAEVNVLVQVFELAQKNKLSYRDSLTLMLKAVLVSPQFLFITPASRTASKETIIPLDDYQLASRLSYLFWSTMPDQELMKLADEGKLHNHDVLQQQVKRLLADPRSRALFDGFGAQWLGLQHLQDKTFDTEKFPQMTRDMRQAMYEEVRLYFESMIRENRSVVDLINSDYTYLNQTLAQLYGLEKSVQGTDFRKVKLTNANRGGILGMPAILASTSLPNRTSPVKRGVWVLEQILGEHVPPAPPNVPQLEKQKKEKVEHLTLRQRTELHRTDPVCANCHKLLDPIGFGLENFDAIGRWREQDDSGGKIDAAGELPGGKHFSTPHELKVIIAEKRDDLARNLIEKLMAYALNRQLEGYDEIVVDLLLKKVAQDDYRMQTLITEVVTSYPFTHCRIKEHVISTPKKK